MEIFLFAIMGVAVFLAIGGTNPILIPHLGAPLVPLAASQWFCEEVYWARPPQLRSGEFSGTLQMDCEFEAMGRGGVPELRRYLVEQVPSVVAEIHGNPKRAQQTGMKGVTYDVTLRVHENHEQHIRGKTNIVSNGKKSLRSNFEATKIPTSGSTKHLRALRSEVTVSPMPKKGWYRMTLTSHSRIHKPWYLPSRNFVKKLVSQSEQELANRAEEVLTSFANHM